jgi:hypothetical protein
VCWPWQNIVLLMCSARKVPNLQCVVSVCVYSVLAMAKYCAADIWRKKSAKLIWRKKRVNVAIAETF